MLLVSTTRAKLSLQTAVDATCARGLWKIHLGKMDTKEELKVRTLASVLVKILRGHARAVTLQPAELLQNYTMTVDISTLLHFTLLTLPFVARCIKKCYGQM